MFGNCCSASRSAAFVITGLAGVGIGILGTRAYDATPVTESTTDARISPVAFVQPEGMDPEAIVKMMQEWGATVDEHKVLKAMAGVWDCETKFWMGPEDPMVGTGTSMSQLVLGDRYVTQHFTMPDMMGMPFEGMGAVGFDKTKGKYVNVWLDNFNTGFMIMEGEFDEATHTMTWTGTAVSPMGESEVKHVIKFEGDDKMLMEFWEPDPATGKMMNNGLITYTRRN